MFRRLLVVACLVLCASAALARERAVMIYPRERVLFRRVFYTAHQDALIARLGETYDVTVYEHVATDDQLFAIDVDGAELLVLSGHGDPFAMYLAGRKERTLDATDRERLKAFLDRLAPDATIVLQSCHTGQGFAHLVKEAAGPNRTVIAARGVVPRDGVEITSVVPFDATILCNDGSGMRWDCTVRLR